ncbi:LysR substrate-binding domain-containing protein [Erwinia sp. P6884]|uniref:LysR substrate-binding domain-containing protein n=1 Tax=Erwinia sp. P6884 TaxID=3141450 RepID=UPI00318AEC64
MKRASLNELEAVIAIARRGTFRAAAIDLGLSTTALSHTIGKLEAGLGVRLFNRTTRSVSLTEAGKLFVEHVGPALQNIHGALDTVRSQRETPSGTIRINVPPFAAREILSPLIFEFLRRYPDMQVDLVTNGRLVDIVAEGFDLGVRVASLVPNDMIAVSLSRTQRYAIVGSPGYFRDNEKPGTPFELLNHRCIRIRLPDGSLFRWRFEKEGEAIPIDVCGPLLLDEASLARAAVIEGIGIGFFMEQDVLADIEAGALIRVLEEWTTPFAGVCLYYAGRRNLSAGLRAFLDLARELAAESFRG